MSKRIVLFLFVLGILFSFLAVFVGTRGNVFVHHQDQSIEVDREDVLPLAPPTISQEITFLTTPIDEFGYVDYLAALNESAKANITPEENAMVVFAETGIGLAGYSPSQREEFCRFIGIEPASASQIPFVLRNDLADNDPTLKRALSGPWKESDLPDVMAWIESNTAALEILIRGTKRPNCYIPLLADQASDSGAKLINVLLPVHQAGREVTRCLVARAMLRLGKSELDLAREDLMAVHRLGRLLGRAPFLMCGLVGCAIDSQASEGDIHVLQSGLLDAAAAKSYQSELQQLPIVPPMVDKLAFGDRLSILDMITSMEIAKATNDQANENLRKYHDEVLRVCNERFDTFVAALRLPTYSERKSQEKVLDELLRSSLPPKYKSSDKNAMSSFQAKKREELAGKPPSEVGRAVGESVVAMLFPNFADPITAENRTRARYELVQLGLALMTYKLENREFPQTLQNLVPQYISSVPTDAFSDEPYRYEKTGFGCRVWSIGNDGIDHVTQAKQANVTRDDIVLPLE